MFQNLKKSLTNKLSRTFCWYSKTCFICKTRLNSGQCQALLTAECKHTFHYNCVAAFVQYGKRSCPICRASWADIPLPPPSTTTGYPYAQFSDKTSEELHGLTVPNIEPESFTDDEPLPQDSSPVWKSAASKAVVTLKIFPEFPAIAASESRDKFPALVKVCAPQLHHRTPVDLVCVLDVSGSMLGSKIHLLKQAMHFVIQSLSPMDRLSIITFSSQAKRMFPLTRMSDKMCRYAESVIDSLSADGGTNILQGLEKGVKVLVDRKHYNPVSGIILLSDGRDGVQNFSSNNSVSPAQRTAEFVELLLDQIQDCDKQITIPVHTFGFGSDHDSSVMHAISDASCGTFSFIESIGIIQDAFAMCIGGLFTVVAQNLSIEFSCLEDDGVQIKSYSSGKYRNEISREGRQGSISVRCLYAEEEKDFLIYLAVPRFSSSGQSGEENRTQLFNVSCSYKSLATDEIVRIQDHTIEINRPEVVSPNDKKISLEVVNKRNKLLVVEAIAEAHLLAEAGDIVKAQDLLERQRELLLASELAKAGDSVYLWLESELTETKKRMEDMEVYEKTGRAYALSGLSSHSLQRATSRGLGSSKTTEFNSSGKASASGPIAYETPRMVSMVSMSRELRTASSAKMISSRCGKSSKSYR